MHILMRDCLGFRSSPSFSPPVPARPTSSSPPGSEIRATPKSDLRSAVRSCRDLAAQFNDTETKLAPRSEANDLRRGYGAEEMTKNKDGRHGTFNQTS